MPQDANLTPSWSQLGASWVQLCLILPTKMSISCGRGCIFRHIGDLRLKTPQVASRWPEEAPMRPQDGPRRLQEGPKTVPREAKMAPRRPQDGSKTAPSRIQKQLYVSFTSRSPKMPPRSLQNPPKEPQEAPKEPPRGP